MVLRNIELSRCREMGCDLYGAVLEDVVVDDLTRVGRMPIRLAACAYRHVVLKGRIPQLTFTHVIGTDPESERQPRWDRANTTFYDTVDWALDTSEAEFGSQTSLYGIPAALVRRDPTDQVVLTRAGASTVPWQEAIVGAWAIAIDWFLDSNQDSLVVVAGKRDKKHYNSDLRTIELLRSLGVAQRA